VALNFDAQINVDVAPFLANIERAKGAVKSLNAEINALNAKKVSVQASASAASATNISSEANARKAAANAAMQAMAQQDQMARAMGQTERNNAKVELQSEMMRKQSMDARVKDHRTISNLFDDTITMRDRESKNFSNSLKAELQGREQMNKTHAQANAMNERFDAAKAKAAGSNVRNMARERYALYDVAAAYQQVARMANMAIKEMAGTAISYERAFVNVQRTTEFTSTKVGEAARVMKYSLMEVASQIPVSFGKVTEIATIANQLGIAQGQVASFSKTVAEFATTTGMTVEATAMSFGRIGELMNVQKEVGPGQDAYAKLGSAIAYAGVKAVATETQITSVTKEIATTAKMAKFTTPEVIGLATALSSVGIAPEAARGSIMRTFAGINKAVSDGGSSLQKYADISGMTAEEFKAKWTENGQVAFDAFVKGLQSMSDSGQSLDTVLRSIGLKNVRDIQTIQKLGDNYDVYAESIRNANQAFADGTYLNESYGKIQDTVAAKLELLKNNWDNFVAGLGEGAIGDAFKILLDGINAALKAMTDMSRSPVGYWLGVVLIGISSLVTILGTLAGAMALGKAAWLAFGTAMESMAGASGAATAGLLEVDAAILGTAAAAGEGTAALTGLKIATMAVGTALKAAGWIAALAGVAAVVVAIGDAIYRAVDPMGAMTSHAESLLGGFSGLQDAMTSDTVALKENAKAAGMTEAAYAAANGIIIVHTDQVAKNDKAAQDAVAAHNTLATIVGNEPAAFTDAANGIAQSTFAIGQNTIAWMRNAMVQSNSFKEIAKNKDLSAALKAGNYDLTKATAAAASGNLDKYFSDVVSKAKKALGQTAAANQDWWGIIVDSISGAESQTKVFSNGVGSLTSGVENAINSIKDTIGGSYNELLLLGLGSEQAAKKVGDAFKVPTTTVKKLGDAAKKTKDAVKTVVDYASQMVSIFKRIDDIKFNNPLMKNSTAADEITAGWKAIKDSATEAADAIKKANESIAGLTADKGILEYKLSVAVRYGDEKRANALRAELAKKTTEIADANAELTKAQEKANTSLTDGTEAGAANRNTIIGMLGTYQSYIQALIATGVKGTDLENKIKDLKQGFIDQGKQVGFNETELTAYAGQFDQYAKAVHDTPRDVTIEFDVTKSDEFNAVQEYLAKEHLLNVKIVYDSNGVANSSGAITGGGTSGATGGGSSSTSGPAINSAGNLTYGTSGSNIPASVNTMAELAMYNQRKATLQKSITTIQDNLNRAAAGRASTATIAALKSQLAAAKAKLASGNFASGGYVSGPGTGTSDSISANLSNGEYVVRAAAVRAYGVDYMNSLNQMKTGSMPMSMGAGGSNGSQVVYLSPDDRALLRAAIERPVNLFAETGKIASSANAGNVLIAQRGLN
jgi:TP901 family phage tail tape measure protein